MPGLASVNDSNTSSSIDSMPGLEAVTDSSNAGSTGQDTEEAPISYLDIETTAYTSATVVGTAATRDTESDLYDSGVS